MREAFLWCVRRGLTDWDPPLGKAPKEGGYPPPIPPLLGWVERARDLGTRWVYIEKGKARFMSLQMADE